MFWIASIDKFLFKDWSNHFCREGHLVVALFFALTLNPLPLMGSDTSESNKKLVIFGDSLTAGYGLRKQDAFGEKLARALREKGHRVNIIVSSVSGDTTTGGKAWLDWVLADKPDAVIIELGANDGLRGINPKVSRKNLDYILKKLKLRKIRVLLTGMLAPPNLGREYGEEFNSIFPDLARKHNFSLYPFFLQGVVSKPEFNLADGIHPNPKGVDIIVKGILPMVMELIR